MTIVYCLLVSILWSDQKKIGIYFMVGSLGKTISPVASMRTTPLDPRPAWTVREIWKELVKKIKL
jgi:hypothetical protein